MAIAYKILKADFCANSSIGVKDGEVVSPTRFTVLTTAFCGLKQLHHLLNLHGLLKVIEPMRFDPPRGRFHEKFWIFILVGEEGVKG